MSAVYSEIPDRETLRQMAQIHPVAWAMYCSGAGLVDERTGRAAAGDWRRARHLSFLSDLLMKVERGEIKRLAISVPPRGGKSQLISKSYTSWYLGNNPRGEVVLASYSLDLARQFSAGARDDLAAFGGEVFGVTTPESSSPTEWYAHEATGLKRGARIGGHCYAVGRGGGLTGRGADRLVVDDLIKGHEEAESEATREACWNWFLSEALSRLSPEHGAVIVVMTRWHHDDVIGRLKTKQAAGEIDGWTFVNVPAIAEEDDALGREVGEVLWPERFSREWWEAKRREVGPHVWSALYQGSPTPASGGFFKKSWFKYYQLAGDRVEIPGRGSLPISGLWRFATADLATSVRSQADYTVIGAWGYSAEWKTLFLLGLFRERVEGPALIPALKGMCAKHDLAVVFLEKTGGFMLSTVQAARKEGLPVRDIKADTDKITRALPATARLESGEVLFPVGAAFLPELEAELLKFPKGSHDDQVDVVAYAVRVFESLRGLKNRPAAKSKSNAYKRRGPGGGRDTTGRDWRIGR